MTCLACLLSVLFAPFPLQLLRSLRRPVEASAFGALEPPKAGFEILVSVVLALSLVGLPVREQMESAPSVALAWCMPGLERRHSSVA